MRKNKAYTDKDIEVLSDIEHVRMRLPIYFGSNRDTQVTVPDLTGDLSFKEYTIVPAAFKAVGEILDNSIDEFSQINTRNKQIVIVSDPEKGHYTISDNGRGVPVTKHSTGKYTPEVVFGNLRSGRNFSDDREQGVQGQNGVGSSCVCFTSTEFKVDIIRDNIHYTQTFSEGATVISKPKRRKIKNNKSGTEISFTLDPTVYSQVALPAELMEQRAIEIAATNPGITVNYNNTKYKFKNGLVDVISKAADNYHQFKYSKDTTELEFFVIFDKHDDIDERMFTYVNSSPLFDGGICNTQFLNAFVSRVVEHLKPAAKKQKCDVTKNDVRQGLTVIGNMKIANPDYDSQSKTRLTSPNLRKEMTEVISQNWGAFVRANKDWLDGVLKRAADRHHTAANKKAVNELAKSSLKKVEGLMDATSKARFNCQLLITEGLSAAGMISDVRDAATMGSFPLSGKFNNVYGATIAQLLKMGKITNLIRAIGLIPGQKAERGSLRYGKIVIATDSDYDGDDIFTLMINLFFQFWPELFDPKYEPIVYRLIAPNVVAVKGSKRVHFTNRVEYEKQKNKYKNFEISYYKGLGSMVQDDWKKILTGESNTLIPITDDGNLADTLKLLFGPDSDRRKQWLQSN